MNKTEKQELKKRYEEIVIDVIDAYALYRLLAEIADTMVQDYPFLDATYAKELSKKSVSNCPTFKLGER